MEIRSAQNGFILELHGMVYVTKTLTEAAELVGECSPTPKAPTYIDYTAGYSVLNLVEVKRYAQNREKITAIKMLREMYTPRMSLLVAKELVETMV